MTAAASPQDSLALRTAELVAKFIDFKKATGRSPKTIQHYKWILDKFVEAFQTVPLDADEIVAWLWENRGHTDSTRSGYYRDVRAFYNYLVQRRHIIEDDNPMKLIEAPKVKDLNPVILTVEQMRKVIDKADNPRDRQVMLVLADTGIRTGELVGLTKDDIEGNTLRVEGKSGRRVVPISPELVGMLRTSEFNYIAYTKEWELGNQKVRVGKWVDRPLTNSGVYQLVQRLMRKAKVADRKLGAHTFRHSFATNYIAAGGDPLSLQKILGHAEITTTTRYVGLSTEELQKKHQAHSPFQQMIADTKELARRQAEDALPGVLDQPLAVEGELVQFELAEEWRTNGSRPRMFYHIRGMAGEERWIVAGIGVDLEPSFVSAYKRAVVLENARRQRMYEAKVPNDAQANAKAVLEVALADSEFGLPCPVDDPFVGLAALLWHGFKFDVDQIASYYKTYSEKGGDEPTVYLDGLWQAIDTGCRNGEAERAWELDMHRRELEENLGD